jgi:integrase/recombinase XerD
LVFSGSRSRTTARTRTISQFNDRIENIATELSSVYTGNLLYAAGANAFTIIDYITVMKTETNYTNHYGNDTIGVLCRFSKYHNNRPFKEVSRNDIINFLDSLRKTETQDPLHKWIGTYNVYRMYLFRFFKWLHSPDLEPSKRAKPSVIENIPTLKRREKSIYKPSDLWTQQDDLLFLKYCPSKRDKCYHAISRDSSARPNEILKLKIRDVVFKKIGTSQYAEAVVNGKTGTRSIPLINSIPYLKDYLDHEHPQDKNRNAPLICGIGKKLGRHINPTRIRQIYDEYKNDIFPKMLESPEVLPEDKPRIIELLKKPWNPYIRRHSALTEKAQILKDPILKMHAGWSQSSQMHLKYEHWFGNESNKSLLEAYGLVDHGIQIDQLRSKQCPQCNEPNKPDARFCANTKCRMVLSYDAWEETLQQQDQQKLNMEKYQIMFERIETLEKQLQGKLK